MTQPEGWGLRVEAPFLGQDGQQDAGYGYDPNRMTSVYNSETSIYDSTSAE